MKEYSLNLDFDYKAARKKKEFFPVIKFISSSIVVFSKAAWTVPWQLIKLMHIYIYKYFHENLLFG